MPYPGPSGALHCFLKGRFPGIAGYVGRQLGSGARVGRAAGYYWLLLAEGHLNTAGVWGDGAPDHSAAGGDRIRRGRQGKANWAKKGGRDGEVSDKSRENEAIPAFPVPGRGRVGSFVGRRSGSGWKARTKRPQRRRWGVYWMRTRMPKWKSWITFRLGARQGMLLSIAVGVSRRAKNRSEPTHERSV
jgi:hypothetical protein